MFAAQQRFYEETFEVSADQFRQLTEDAAIKDTFLACMKLYEEFLHTGDKKQYDAMKRKLPLAMYMCTFEPNTGSKGNKAKGRWRNQKAARLNGLVMVDFDCLEDPMAVYKKIPDHFFDRDCAQQILLAHITPSGHGLRLVFKADLQVGNIADNQKWLSTKLGLKADEACKDASRGSFFPCDDAILFLDEQLFSYNNERFDKEFGEYYRRGKSLPPRPLQLEGELSAAGQALQSNGAGHPLQSEGDGGRPEALSYDGIPYSDLVQRWLEQNGTPNAGGRHHSMLRMAGDFRYITDYRKLGQVLRLAPYVKEWESDASVTQEIDDIVRDVCARQQYWKMPRRMQKVLDSLSPRPLQLEGELSAAGHPLQSEGDGGRLWYKTFAARMRPLLAPPYDDACKLCTEENWFGAILASGAMFGTLMTRCWYEHYDGKPTRINPQVYIIGDPATGKSFVDRLDHEIMACMRAADEVGREAERRYKEEKNERASSRKAANGEVLKRPEPVIRYVPARTSNAVFYRRSINAKEMVDGELMNLHLYTFDSELDSTVTAQSGGSWINKHDIELKAFSNELSGVDYGNADSVNALIPIFWNTVTTGTPVSLGKKISRGNINTGLSSRVAIFKMWSRKYQMLPRGSAKRNHDLELALKEWGYFFDQQKGELKVKALVDKAYELCEMSAFEAELASDDVLDYIRRRAVYYCIWTTLPRIVARLRNNKDAEIEVTDDDLKFAELIYDGVLYWQDKFFGETIEKMQNQTQELFPERKSRTLDYNSMLLPFGEEFTTKDAVTIMGGERTKIYHRLAKMESLGLIERLERGSWKKK